MESGDPESLHGRVGTGLGSFSRLMPAYQNQPDPALLRHLGGMDVTSGTAASGGMVDEEDRPGDEPDPEENLYVPAGYTYFGQFVDHDLTFDTTSTLDITDHTAPSNARSPSLDLDNVYGAGPDAAPFMYQDGIRLIDGGADLPRSTGSLRAIIGDPRNDENAIVCNLQMAFIRFHNKVVDRIESAHPNLKGTRELFDRARNEVRWTYQMIIVKDFLRRIVNAGTYEAFEFRRSPSKTGLTLNESAYRLYTKDKRHDIPLEFSGAAYRFGHSMVRSGYRLNEQGVTLIFAKAGQDQSESLVGFQPLLPKHVIKDWSVLLPSGAGRSKANVPGQKDDTNLVGAGAGDATRLQYAYRIDTTFVNPLAFLPPSVDGGSGANLGIRNLLRGAKFQLPFGQAVADAFGVPVLDSKYLVVRSKTGGKGKQTYVPIDSALQKKTPLWFYILAEAQVPMVDWWLSRPRQQDGSPGTFSEQDLIDNAGLTATQLGETGGNILLEVFNGLLDADPRSYRNHPAADGWTGMIEDFTLWNLVNARFKQA